MAAFPEAGLSNGAEYGIVNVVTADDFFFMGQRNYIESPTVDISIDSTFDI